MQESLIRSLSQEDPLEKETATLSSILAWRIPRAPWRAAADWAERQVGAKGRRSAGLLGRPAAAAPVYGHTTLNAPISSDLGS